MGKYEYWANVDCFSCEYLGSMALTSNYYLTVNIRDIGIDRRVC